MLQPGQPDVPVQFRVQEPEARSDGESDNAGDCQPAEPVKYTTDQPGDQREPGQVDPHVRPAQVHKVVSDKPPELASSNITARVYQRLSHRITAKLKQDDDAGDSCRHEPAMTPIRISRKFV